MALTGKLTGQMEMSLGWDLLYVLLLQTPEKISSIRPDSLHGCDLISGERGAVGSTIRWIYTHDGKKKSSTQIIEAVDLINHKIVFKVIGGELVEIYKTFTITFHVEPKLLKQLATWTFEFEKTDASVPDPTSLMDLMCSIIKDLDVLATLYKSLSSNNVMKERT